MRLPIRFAAFALAAALAACGKIGPPDEPPGSIYPRTYPAGAPLSAMATTPLGPRNAEPETNTIQGPAAANVPAFTARGAWIDPDMRKPTIDPNADLDRWHLNNPVGY